jgi:hypothetical protein
MKGKFRGDYSCEWFRITFRFALTWASASLLILSIPSQQGMRFSFVQRVSMCRRSLYESEEPVLLGLLPAHSHIAAS